MLFIDMSSMGNSQDSGAVYLSLFEKGEGAIGILEFKLPDFSLLNFFRTKGRNRQVHEIQRLHRLSLSSRFSQKDEKHFAVFHIEGNQGRLVSLRIGFT
jgi:hypothetical protein